MRIENIKIHDGFPAAGVVSFLCRLFQDVFVRSKQRSTASEIGVKTHQAQKKPKTQRAKGVKRFFWALRFEGILGFLER